MPDSQNPVSDALRGLLRAPLENLREAIESSKDEDTSWERPFLELRYPVEGDWSRLLTGLTDEPEEGAPAGLRTKATTEDLQRFLSDATAAHPGLGVLANLTAPALLLRRGGKSCPVTLADLPPDLDVPDEVPFQFSLNGSPEATQLAGQVFALQLDEDEERAYFRLIVGLQLEDDDEPGTWALDRRQDFWRQVREALRDPEAPNVTPLPPALPTPATREPSAEVLRSIMSPVHIPQEPIRASHFGSLQRGIGRAFSGYKRIPDLDLDGAEAVEDAQKLFWPLLEAHVQEAAPNWRRGQEEGRTLFTLPEVDTRAAKRLWRNVSKALNKDNGTPEGGPGIRVLDPAFRTTTVEVHGEKRPATQLVLWPDESLKDRDGWILPAVRFRRTSSPGYLSLLERHEGERYFADGWFWQPVGEKLEGFRIGGLPLLLFPEGREAISRLEQRKIEDLDTELNRIFYQPSLFKDQDQLTIIRLQDALRKAKNRLRQLQTYDWTDLYCCVFEAFSRQKDAWFQERVVLPDGQAVETKPYRVICLDPKDLRLRLDPGRSWGQNWRGELLRKLDALATFERQTRDLKGNILDTGDRLILRILDGRQGIPEGKAPDDDPGLGLTRVLKKAGAFPTDAFFISPSPDFMMNLFTVVADPRGFPAWGHDAVEAMRKRSLAAGKTEKEARKLASQTRGRLKKPFYQHSPRFQAVANLHGWDPQRKHLGNTFLMERRKKVVELHDEAYNPCNGKSGSGYRIRTWMDKAGYVRRKGPNGSLKAVRRFLDDLQSLTAILGLQLRVRRGPGQTAEVLEFLAAYRDSPQELQEYVLQVFFPTELEDRLRKILAAANIEAVDSHEEASLLFRASAQRQLTPALLRAARKRSGWGQAELAKRLGLTQANVSRWERGKKPIPEKYEVLLREVLGDFLEAEVEAVPRS